MASEISIIICTCNRAENLLQTLEALKSVPVSPARAAELIVVDNASTDGTAEVVNSSSLPQMPIRYISESRRGKGHAYNAGIAAARGQILLFTDDDVRPLPDWIDEMCAPIENSHVQAVAGGVRIASHLNREWMEPWHRAALADTTYLPADSAPELIGANMAFSRAVLAEVPRFDPNLGPGALGFWDDTLFGRQLVQAGFDIAFRPHAQVEHHFQESRLSGAAFAQRSQNEGRSAAYVSYHWYHNKPRHTLVRLLKAKLRLRFLLRKKPALWPHSEGLSPLEGQARFFVSHFEQLLKQRGEPRFYEKQGLIRLDNHATPGSVRQS